MGFDVGKVSQGLNSVNNIKNLLGLNTWDIQTSQYNGVVFFSVASFGIFGGSLAETATEIAESVSEIISSSPNLNDPASYPLNKNNVVAG